MSPKAEQVTVQVEDRELVLSNLDKPLYPTGFTKGDLIDYYARIAPVMLPHLEDRPVTTKRYPNGTTASGFIEKNVPRHAPDWIETVTLPRKGTGWGGRPSASDKETTEFVLVNDLATLIWLANLAAVEFHTPQWRVSRPGGRRSEPAPGTSPDLIVFDLDPGAPAGLAECCAIALRLRDRLGKDNITLVAKTSGSKGLQCYGRVAQRRWSPERPSEYAHAIAEELEAEDPGRVVSVMTKAARPGKVFIDWSQNNPAKTTVTPYSLRALERPRVSTPLGWDEVETGADGDGDLLGLSPRDVTDRSERLGDLFAPLLPRR